MKEHLRLIVKFKEEALYYPGFGGSTEVLEKKGRRVKTIITNDDFICVANKDIKAKIYADGRFEIEKHDNTQKLECK